MLLRANFAFCHILLVKIGFFSFVRILNALQFWVLDNVLMSEKTIPDIRGGDLGK